MAYTPLNWQSGDIVTAEKLNQMKGVILITPTEIDNGDYSLGYSYNDIVAMVEDGFFPVRLSRDEYGVYFDPVARYAADEEYPIYEVDIGQNYHASTPTDILTTVSDDPLL